MAKRFFNLPTFGQRAVPPHAPPVSAETAGNPRPASRLGVMVSMSTPNFKTALIDKVFFIRWEQPPPLTDIQAVSSQFLSAYERLRQPMPTVITTAPKARVPNSEQRKNLFKMLEDHRKYISELHLLMEGNELQHNLQRVIVSAQLIVTRIYDDNYARLHKSADSIAPYLTARLGSDGVRIIHEAREQGLVL